MKLEQLLSTKGLVQHAPSADEIRARASLVYPNPIKLFYGETYDDKGNTVDSMKYYFFVSELADALREEGYNVDPMILVADTAACRNVKEDLERHYLILGADRAQFIEKVNKVYETKLRVMMMSDYISSLEFITKRDDIMKVCKDDNELKNSVEQTVPESKIDIERKKGFLYSFDEITTIIDLDVKVGPPREDLYDNVARQLAQKKGTKKVISLFLTPTFPLGMNWSYFFKNEGIEYHGITAYKAGSKQLQQYRVIPERSNFDYIQNLINKSFISINSDLPNPVLDLGIICELARKKIDNDTTQITLANEFYTGNITPEQLKEKVGKNTEKYILSRL